MSELRKKAAVLVQTARDEGLLGCEVLLMSWQGLELHSAGGGEQPNEGCRAQVRVYLDGGRMGRADAEVIEPARLAKLLERATGLAKKAKTDEIEGPPDRLDIPARGLGIDDPRRVGIEAEHRLEVLSMNETACRSIGPTVVPGEFVYTERRLERTYVSSRGVEADETSTLFSLRGNARLVDQPNLVISGDVQSRHFADVASVPLGVSVARRVVSLERTANLPTEELPILFEPRVVGALLPPIAAAFEAARVEAGNSFLSGRLGEPIGSEKLHVIDDATLVGALNTRAFDDRGTAPIPVPLIREGSAAGLYVGPREARQRQGRPTGHHRFDDTLWAGNLVVRPGNRSRNMIFADLGAYVVIEDVLDSSGIDPATGKVDIPVRVAVGEGGAVVGLVGERRLVGTIESIFGAIVEMASDQERHGTVDCCTWILEGLELI